MKHAECCHFSQASHCTNTSPGAALVDPQGQRMESESIELLLFDVTVGVLDTASSRKSNAASWLGWLQCNFGEPLVFVTSALDGIGVAARKLGSILGLIASTMTGNAGALGGMSSSGCELLFRPRWLLRIEGLCTSCACSDTGLISCCSSAADAAATGSSCS